MLLFDLLIFQVLSAWFTQNIQEPSEICTSYMRELSLHIYQTKHSAFFFWILKELCYLSANILLPVKTKRKVCDLKNIMGKWRFTQNSPLLGLRIDIYFLLFQLNPQTPSLVKRLLLRHGLPPRPHPVNQVRVKHRADLNELLFACPLSNCKKNCVTQQIVQYTRQKGTVDLDH